MDRLCGWVVMGLSLACVVSSGAGLEYPMVGTTTVVDDRGDRYIIRDQGLAAWRGGRGRRGGGSVARAITNAPEPSFFVAKFDSQLRPRNRLWFHNAPHVRATALAAHGTNWIVIAGRVTGETRLGSVPLKPPDTNHGEIFVARLAPDGRFDWVRHFQGSGEGSVSGVAVDHAGNIFFTGELRSGGVDFAGTILATSRTNSGCDAYVVKLDSEGTLCWARRDSGDFVEPRGIATARDGSVYVTGCFFGKFAERQAEKPGADMFLAKYNTSGERLWVTSPGGAPSRYGHNVATDLEGNPYVVGLIQGTRRFGSNTVTQEVGEYNNGYLAKYNPEAELQWVRQFRRADRTFGKVTALASATVLETNRATAAGSHIANLDSVIKASGTADSTISDDELPGSMVSSAPKLSIFKQGDQFLIVWPGHKGDFVLESTDSILPLAVWTPVPSEQTHTDSLVMAVVDRRATAKFYRLRSP